MTTSRSKLYLQLKKIRDRHKSHPLFSSDFLKMLEKSKPYIIDSEAGKWKWSVPWYEDFPKIVEVVDPNKPSYTHIEELTLEQIKERYGEAE